MRAYYEDLWERMPERGEPPDFHRRRSFLLARIGLERGRVLDLGCGTGEFTAALAAVGARPTGAEVAEAALRRARERAPELDFRLVPPEGPLPFADAEFDAVWASEVIEHVTDTGRWLSEVRRVLRPDGLLLLTTPYHGRLKGALLALARFERHFDPRGEHLRFYTPRSLCELLEDFGFVGVELSTTGGPPLLRRTLLARARRARWAG